MDGYEYVGPQTPTLEKAQPSLEFEPFVRAAFVNLGGTITDVAPEILRVTIRGSPEYARLSEDVANNYAKAPLYRPGSPAFLRLVDRVSGPGSRTVTRNRSPLKSGQ